MENTLDVSKLEPCEPLERTLAAIRELGKGDYLRVIHRREPHLLYPMLEKSGFAWRTCPGGPSQFEIFIWRQGDAEAEQAVTQLAS
jgi:uncharacterized protein (DUF2249 family)